MPELPLHPTEPHHAAPPPPHSTPPSQRLRCPHCHNPIQLADGHSDEVLCPACGHTFRLGEARATTSAAPMRPLGKFQLLERIGAGGFGAVWKALDTALDRTVALKIPHTGVLTTAADLERFQREARAAAQLRHPGIVPVHDVVMLEGLPTIISDFVTGVPLKDLMETRRLGTREIALLLAAAADAVHYAHSMGVVHRDLKPANIMVPYAADCAVPGRLAPQLERPLLMDFGLALRSEAEVTMTQDGHVLGTPAYMSPEQAAGRSHQSDARSDVWGLGVVLYELLTGELPFRGSKVMMLMQVMNDDPKPPRRLDGRIPRDMETVCLKCLQKEPARRYATAAELSADLRRFLNGEPVLARRVGRAERLWRWTRRNPAVASLLATVALLLIAGTTVSTYFAVQADRRADEAEKSAERARQKETEARTREKEAAAAREAAQVALARSWLGPLGVLDNEPLIDAEISALWGLSEGRDDGQWERFVREALRTPDTTRQLRNHAGPALHAAIGLDPERRAAVERILVERMQDTILGDDQRTDVALAAVALDNLAPATTASVAVVLVAAMSRTVDVKAMNRLMDALSELFEQMAPKDTSRVSAQAAVLIFENMSKLRPTISSGLGGGLELNWLFHSLPLVEKLEPKDAAAAAAVLAQAMGKTTNADDLGLLSQGLSALAVRMEPKLAARICAENAAVMAQAMSKTTDATLLSPLSQGLVALAERMEPKDAAATAAVVAEAMRKTTDANLLIPLSQGLAALTARMEPREGARVSAETIAVLAQTMSKTTDANLLWLQSGALAALTARMEPKEAARVSAQTAAVLTQAMGKSTDVAKLDSLSQGLSALAERMEPRDAAATAGVLAQVMSKTTNTKVLSSLSQGLSALTNRMEPRDAAATAGVVAQAMCKTTDATVLALQSQGLAALAARMEPKEAARVCADTAVVLSQAMSMTTDANLLWLQSGALAALTARMEPKEAARVSAQTAAVLTQAMGKSTDVAKLDSLSQGLSALAERMEPRDAAATAGVLAQVMSKTTNTKVLSSLSQGLSALTNRMEPRDAAATAGVVAQAMCKTTDATVLALQSQGLAALAARMEPKEAARLGAEVAPIFVLAIGKANHDLNPLQSLLQVMGDGSIQNVVLAEVLTQSLTSILNGNDRSERSRRVAAVAGVVGGFAGTGFSVPSLVLLRPAVEPRPCHLSTQQLVDLLKQPTCQGPARWVVLDYLEGRYRRRFRNHWDFVEYAQRHLPEVDLTTPPKRQR